MLDTEIAQEIMAGEFLERIEEDSRIREVAINNEIERWGEIYNRVEKTFPNTSIYMDVRELMERVLELLPNKKKLEGLSEEETIHFIEDLSEVISNHYVSFLRDLEVIFKKVEEKNNVRE